MTKLKQSIKRILKQTDKYHPWPLFYDFVMTRPERLLFDKTIQDSRQYLEFGMGGSTFRALQKSSAQIYSLDSSEAWMEIMREFLLIRSQEGKRLKLFYVDIGATGDWGYPEDESNRSGFPDYSQQIFSKIDPVAIDTILVDGRFRVACILQSLIHCHENVGLRIMVHDFWEREQYHVVLPFVEELDRADTLAVFRPKRNLDILQVQALYMEYRYISE